MQLVQLVIKDGTTSDRVDSLGWITAVGFPEALDLTLTEVSEQNRSSFAGGLPFSLSYHPLKRLLELL
jgi:hypothetical protein